MTSIAIDRVNTRYRLPAGAREQLRLRRVMDDAIHRALEPALDRAGVSPCGHVCIRELRASAVVALAEPDTALADRLAAAIADEVATAGNAGGASVVYYRSRAHALIDVACRALAGDFERSWAWRQLGIWHIDFDVAPAFAADLVVRGLGRDAAIAPAVIARLAVQRAAAFASLLAYVSPGVWMDLGHAVVDACGAGIEWIETNPPSDQGLEDSRRDLDPARFRDETSTARRVVERSAIARAAKQVHGELPSYLSRTVAVLAVMEVEPYAVRSRSLDADALLARIERALRADSAAPGSDTAALTTQPAVEPSGQSLNQHEAHGPVETPSSIAHVVLVDRTTLVPSVALSAALRASTSAGGLLYLINLVGRLNLPETILGDQRLSGRGLRWVLHQLAMSLTEVGPDDPAALAFAGEAPGMPAPSSLEPPATDSEREAILDHRRSIVGALGGDLRLPGEPEAALAFVCRRRATIAADPGWIEATLSLDDVSIEIRRAALDLNPDWVPWLGVVVRFVYA
jgi:hypothetical protein